MSFGRGYGEVKERLNSKPRYTMSCLNCNWLMEDPDTKEEVCHNKDVLSFDVIIDDNGRVYCHQWQAVKNKKKAVKKRG